MVIRVFISGISGNKEVKKRQQRVLLILDSKNIKYDVVDIAEPEAEELKDFMHNNSKSNGATISDPTPRHPLPPQVFNDDDYCGDYDQFDMANEVDEMEKFLKLAPDDGAPVVTSSAEVKLGNGDAKMPSKEATPEPIEETNEAEAKNLDDNHEAEANNVEETNNEENTDDKKLEESKVDENQTDEQKLENGKEETNETETAETED